MKQRLGKTVATIGMAIKPVLATTENGHDMSEWGPAEATADAQAHQAAYSAAAEASAARKQIGALSALTVAN